MYGLSALQLEEELWSFFYNACLGCEIRVVSLASVIVVITAVPIRPADDANALIPPFEACGVDIVSTCAAPVAAIGVFDIVEADRALAT